MIATWKLLENAKKRIQDASNWARGTCYASAERPDSENRLTDACSFCSIGAVAAEIGIPHGNHIGTNGTLKEDWLSELYGKQFSRAKKYLDAAATKIGRTNVITFNDRWDTEHPDVLRVFDLAIRNAKRRHVNGKRYANVSK